MSCDHPPYSLKGFSRDPDRRLDDKHLVALQGWCEDCHSPVEIDVQVFNVESMHDED